MNSTNWIPFEVRCKEHRMLVETCSSGSKAKIDGRGALFVPISSACKASAFADGCIEFICHMVKVRISEVSFMGYSLFCLFDVWCIMLAVDICLL